MAALSIVPGFDIVEYRIVSCDTSFQDRIPQFRFQRAEETLDDGVVPTIAFPTHALPNAVCSKQPYEGLRSHIGCRDPSERAIRLRVADTDRGLQSVDHQAPIHGQFHRPSNHASREKIEDNGEIKPPFSRKYVMSRARTRFVLPITETSKFHPRTFSAIGSA